jgi:predicted nucleic acid-binding protein
MAPLWRHGWTDADHPNQGRSRRGACGAAATRGDSRAVASRIPSWPPSRRRSEPDGCRAVRTNRAPVGRPGQLSVRCRSCSRRSWRSLIVVDATVLVPALSDDGEHGQRARARLARERLAAPELIDLEVASVLRRMCAASKFDTNRADQAITDLVVLQLERVPHRHLIARCWELRHNVTPYDASYIAVAEAFGATLLTADARLANAPGSFCSIEVFG